MTDLNTVIEFAETSERYDTFKILEACTKIRKEGPGKYSKMVRTGELDFHDYGVGFINFEIFPCFQAQENQYYSRIWFATIDDGDMGAWVPFPSLVEAIQFNDLFADVILKNLSVFPTLEGFNKKLWPFGISISRE